jgi:hypothetical protein
MSNIVDGRMAPAIFALLFFASGQAFGQNTITVDIDDLSKIPATKKLLDDAVGQLRKHAQGNEGGVSVKSARAKNVTFDAKSGKATAGNVTLVFDMHHRHRTTQDSYFLGRRIPGIVAYDRHEEVLAEYDIQTGRGKARVAKGPLGLPLLPQIPWELWVNFDVKSK